MEDAEREFWIALSLWGGSFLTILGTGLWAIFIDGDYISGTIVSGLGIGGLLYMSQHLRGRSLKRNHAVIGALILTWVFFAFNVYDRHRAPSVPPELVQRLMFLKFGAWGGCPNCLQVWNQNFENRTVRLDSRFFHNCTFHNVTFEYEGNGPFFFDPAPPSLTGDNHVTSQDNAVLGAFNVLHYIYKIPFENEPPH